MSLTGWLTFLVQRGGEGNVHRDAGAQTTHKGLADKLKDKMFKKSEK